jgi:23S rRNA (uracil1939-C5)-methyltransferase
VRPRAGRGGLHASAIDLVIEALDASGDGVARTRAGAVTVPFTIPGERVRVELDRSGRSAWPLELIEPSPHRVEPRCPHFGPCGGCAWQHISYPEQLRLKRALVERMIRAAVADAPPVQPTLPGADIESPWGYRQKVHFVFANASGGRGRNGRERSGPLAIGHYARRSRRVVPVRECPVHDERGNALAFHLHRQFAAAGVQAVGTHADQAHRAQRPSQADGVLRGLVVRVARRTNELLTTLVVAADRDRRLRDATKRALGTAPPTALHLNLHADPDAFAFGRSTRRVTGAARLREQVAGVAFLLSPTAFFQTNVRAAETLVELVRAAVPEGARVLDLYAGAGLFALSLARAGHVVTAVEESRAAVADGEASRALNRIPEAQCRFITRPVEAALRSLPRADAVVLDPPRGGCAVPVLDALVGALRPPRIVYVSCNPEPLAADLARAVREGYRIVSIQPVDMFPHTAHVETVVVLDRGDGG